jgi:phosphoadenosine phosphosulfate reductase
MILTENNSFNMTTFNTQHHKTSIALDRLNDIFTPLSPQERIKRLYHYFKPEDVLYTSSFGTKSVFLLHLVSSIQANQKVHFINTGYHFPETIAYKQQLARLFGLDVQDIKPDATQHNVTKREKTWQHEPALCCSINKVLALEAIKPHYKVWISGVMGYQTNHRSDLNVFEWIDGMLKFHPIIDIDEGAFLYHLSYHNLPGHPLEKVGYGSIGCSHCTAKGAGRTGRWKGIRKTECGLHTPQTAST